MVRAGYNQTALADREIREAGFAVFAPTVFRAATPPRRDRAGVVHPGRPDRVDYLFVRYVITRLNLADPAWHNVRRLPGVERIISGSHSANGGIGVPIAVPDAAIAWVRGLDGFNENGCIYPGTHRAAPIKAGTALRMRYGPASDYMGVCELSDGMRITMLMGWFNRPTHTTARQSDIEAA